jgi:hypothetical protein
MIAKELWTFLFLLGVLLFNWPLLSIFDLSMPYYLFGTWGLFIGAVAAITALGGRHKAG